MAAVELWPTRTARAFRAAPGALLSGALLCGAFACGSSGSSGPAGAGDPGRVEGLGTALERALATRTIPPDFRAEVGCRQEGRWRSALFFASGVGIWDERVQFALPPPRLLELLRAFAAADFSNLPPLFGEQRRDPRTPQGQGLREICRVALTLEGESKLVQQLERGEQSETLGALAEELLGAARAAAADGVRAASLTEGLEKLASGDLAPEALHLVLQRREGSPAAGPARVLRLRGAEAAVEMLGQDGAVSSRQIPEALFRRLVDALLEARFVELPGNLYAPGYTDLLAEVLGHRHEVQAREFAGGEPEPEELERLRQILAAAEEIEAFLTAG